MERNRPSVEYRKWLRRQIRLETQLLNSLAACHGWMYQKYAELLLKIRADRTKARARRAARRARYALRGRTEGGIKVTDNRPRSDEESGSSNGAAETRADPAVVTVA